MSLAEQIAFLTNPTPVFQDPEDDQDKVTRAKVTDFHDEYQTNDEDGLPSKKKDDGDDVIVGRSSLRAQTAPRLYEYDERYAGKKISRKELNQLDEDDDEEGDSDDGSEGDMEIKKFKEQMGMESEGDSEDEDEEEDEEYEDYEKSKDGEEKRDLEKDEGIDTYKADGDAMGNDNGTEVRHFSQMCLNTDAKKGNAIKCQLGLWDNLLESRIKMQKLMMVANQLPQHDVWKEFSEKGGNEFETVAKQTTKKIETLLETLVNIQDVLLSRNPETKFILDPENGLVGNKQMASPESDEEIPSDTEDEAEEGKEKEQNGKAEEPMSKIKKRKLNTDDYEEFLTKRHRSFVQFRNATIDKWGEKTKLNFGKPNKSSFGAFEQSTVKQIENIMMDKQRLIKRTQKKRNDYIILGKTTIEPPTDGNESKGEVGKEKKEDIINEDEDDYDEEIFDDNDFYHSLLRDLIERKTANVSDPTVLGRQWLEIQKLRSKMKKKNVDTRASKGRKIRYDVHPKLINFMAPVDICSVTDDAKDELFKSLFGKISVALEQ